ncbi:MAG: hypothetical protein K2W93_13360 [Burkholderiaceae bacterium]|nr:hypothetical protein [Burkholderiaceae bacterium]
MAARSSTHAEPDPPGQISLRKSGLEGRGRVYLTRFRGLNTLPMSVERRRRL